MELRVLIQLAESAGEAGRKGADWAAELRASQEPADRSCDGKFLSNWAAELSAVRK